MNDKSKDLQHPSPEISSKFIDLMEKELTLKTQELEIRRQSESNNHDYAKIALEANLKDREKTRDFSLKAVRDHYLFIGLIVLGFFILLGFAMAWGKDQITMEILKATLYMLPSGFGGYAIGKSSKNTKQQ